MKRRIRAYMVVGLVILLVILGLTLAYFRYGVFRSDKGIDLWLLFAWAIAVIVMVVIIHRRVKEREKMVRWFYLSEDGIYNIEIVYAPLSHVSASEDPFLFVPFMANSLVEMSYGFEVADAPSDFKPAFIITTDSLEFHRPDGDDEGSAVIDEWKGSLLRIAPDGSSSSDEVIGSYANARELSFLLEEYGPFR